MLDKKIHWKSVFNSDYLGSCDLEDGKDLKCVIKSVSIQKVKGTDGKQKDCNVALFTDATIKPMILNATNCKVIKSFTKSAYINDWNNVAVQIYIKGDVQAFGDVTEGLRIRESQPSMSKPKLNRDMPAWIKAVEAIKSKSKTIADIEKVYDLTGVKDDLLREAV
jgi:hypothetical protein